MYYIIDRKYHGALNGTDVKNILYKSENLKEIVSYYYDQGEDFVLKNIITCEKGQETRWRMANQGNFLPDEFKGYENFLKVKCGT